MREIKFRAWFEPKKKMYDVGEISFIDEIVMLTEEDESVRCRISKATDIHLCELMQFTGLYDRNGKEIYEGNVVKTIYEEFRPEYGITQTHEEIEQIVFIEGAFQLKITDGEFSWFRPLCEKENAAGVILKDIEVLGNVYENPELLEVKE